MQDLSNRSLAQLRTLDLQVSQELKRRHFQGLNEAREQIFRIARNAGVSLESLLSTTMSDKPKAERRAAIFRNPANPSQEWSGRGRKPHWIKEWVDSGKNLDDARL